MDFFASQERAQQSTRRLVGLFALAVSAIVAAVYLAVRLLLYQLDEGGTLSRGLLDLRLFAWTAGITLAIVLIGSLYKVAQLRRGGEVIARLLGGRPVDPNSAAGDERRLLNVVEEMALAAGVRVPTVFVLDAESAVNAFAAGFGPTDAVLGVTGGAMRDLSRDELQGVIGHEFSHVVNGDMRLNLRLVGLLHGILVIALIGYWILRSMGSSSRGSSSGSKKGGGGGAIALFGLALLAIGGIGVFFGRLIKAAVSRQREFLADAASVQYTRNPAGLAGALERIGRAADGAKLATPKAEEASHFYFADGMGKRLFAMLATHPPLAERIRRLDPGRAGLAEFEASPAAARAAPEARADESVLAGVLAAAGRAVRSTPAAEVAASVGRPTAAHLAWSARLLSALPEALRAGAREPLTAQAIVCGLLLDPRDEVRARQQEVLAEAAAPVRAEGGRIAAALAQCPPEARLALVDLSLPALRQLSDSQYRAFAHQIERLIAADGRVGLFEFALERLLRRHLAARYLGPPARHSTATELASLTAETRLLLSALAWCGGDEAAVPSAYAAALQVLPGIALPSEPLARAECGLSAIDGALGRLATLRLAGKRSLLQAAAAAVSRDGRLSAGEGELLRAIADSLDCPLPPLGV